jgi:RNA 3'-terminal phosphate cyclase
MSKQLAISTAFSIFTTAAFMLTATPASDFNVATTYTGATTQVAAPAIDRFAPVLSGLIR